MFSSAFASPADIAQQAYRGELDGIPDYSDRQLF